MQINSLQLHSKGSSKRGQHKPRTFPRAGSHRSFLTADPRWSISRVLEVASQKLPR